MSQTTSTLPQHIGYIIDGNRRWAKRHGLPPYEGHLAGYTALKDVVRETHAAGIPYVSAYVFSTENWKRSSDEVRKLMRLVLRLVTTDLPEFQKNDIRVIVAGSRERLDQKIIAAIENAEATTARNASGTFVICFNYGGHKEITEAIKKIVHDGIREDDITEELIAQYLYVPQLPPADVIVRSGGDQRISNYMLWRAAYSEFIFIKKSWPDMTKDDVHSIIEEYAKRQRRFGS